MPSGIFANATSLGIVGYLGTGARAVADCGVVTVAIGASSSGNGSSASPTFPAISLANSNNTSWVLAAMFNATSGTVCTPAGMVAVSGATAGGVGIADTNGPVSNWPVANCATGSPANWLTAVIEIIVPPANPPSLAQLVNGDGGGYLYSGDQNPGNPFYRFIDPVAGPGNFEIFSLIYSYSPTRALSITDDKGDSGISIASCNDANYGQSGSLVLMPLSTGATQFTINFDSPVMTFSESHHQFSGLAGGSPVTGIPSCTVANQLSAPAAIGNLADPIGTTPGTNGALIYSAFMDEGDGGNLPVSDVIWGPGFTGLYADTAFAFTAEAQIQATAAPVQPSISIIQPGTSDEWIIMTAALSTGPDAGTPRTGGAILRMSQGNIQSGSLAPMIFPCDAGNFINFTFEADGGPDDAGPTVTSVADTAGNAYAQQVPGTNDYPQYWNAANAICNGQDFAMITFIPQVSASLVKAYEITNADTSGALDTAAISSATFNSQAVTVLAAPVTSATQTNLTLATPGGINNGDYLDISTEVVEVTAGGGTNSITVSRGQFGTAALSNIGPGTEILESLQSPMPAVTTLQANELILAAMNQTIGPNWGSLNCTYDLGSFPQQLDNTTSYANGDGICHAYAPAAGTYNLGYYVSNGGQSTVGFCSAIAVRLQSTVSDSGTVGSIARGPLAERGGSGR
jgi:hypothetical protein